MLLKIKRFTEELSKTLCKLELDELGRCKDCERIQNGMKAALSATPEQYPALREEYRQYTILPEEYAAKLLGCL